MLPVSNLGASPLTARCARVFSRPTHLCVGISPFNGYFTTDRIAAIAGWALAAAPRVDFFVPDAPAAWTLRALGYPPGRAAWKARRQGQYVHNKIRTALRRLRVPDQHAGVLGWQALFPNGRYRALLAEVHRTYRRDAAFRRACQDASGWVLANRLPAGRPPDPAQTRHAARYLLAELPLLLDTPTIVGAAASLFCYHQAPPFISDLYQHRLAVRPAPGQGFAVIGDTGPDPGTG